MAGDTPKLDPDRSQWEPYNLDADFAQADNLAQSNPGKLREMQDLFWIEAARHSRSRGHSSASTSSSSNPHS